jgi:hypothetical protein
MRTFFRVSFFAMRRPLWAAAIFSAISFLCDKPEWNSKEGPFRRRVAEVKFADICGEENSLPAL